MGKTPTITKYINHTD